MQIGNDFFEVKGVSNSGLILSGNVTTSSDASHSIYVDRNGAEQSITMKTVSLLETIICLSCLQTSDIIVKNVLLKKDDFLQ